MGLLGEAITEGYRKGKRRARREQQAPPPPPRPQPQEFAENLGLGGESPFAEPVRQQRRRVRRASRALPGRPSARETTRAYRKTSGYARALAESFDAQPEPVRNRILERALRSRTRDGDILLRHVQGERARDISWYFGARNIAENLSDREPSPFAAFVGRVGGALKEGLTPYSPDEIGSALQGEPSLDPQLQSLLRVQRGLTDLSEGATGLVERGRQKGILGPPKQAGIPAPNSEFGINVLKDALNIPAQAIPSVGLPASMALEGDVGGAADLLAQPYRDLARDPGRAFSEHPLANALLIYGPASTASRGIGAAGRRAGVRAFSTERAPQTIPGTALARVRSYHRDPAVKALQVANERFQRRRARHYDRQADEALAEAGRQPELAASFESTAQEFRHKAAERNPDIMSPHAINKVVDDLEGVNQAIRAANLQRVAKPVRGMLKETKAAGHATSPIAQSIVRAALDDIRTYLGELRSIHDSGALTPAEMSANRTLRAGLEKAIQRARRGDFDPVQVRRAIERVYLPLQRRIQRDLAARDMLPTRQAERAELIPFAARRGMRDLPDEEIRAQMRAEGFPEPAFVTQAPNMRGAKNFYQHYTRARATVGGQARTGQATVRGTFDADPETLLEQVARGQGMVDVHDGFGRAMREGLFRRKGRVSTFQTRRQADLVKRNLEQLPGAQTWRVVNIRPFARRGDDVRDILDGISDDAQSARSVADILSSALKAEGDGPFGIVPEAFANRMQAHVDVLGAGGGLKLLRLATGAFRRTVLATSPTWLAGNIVEAQARTLINRATPADAVFAHRVAKRIEQLDPEAGATFRARAQQGGFMGFTRATVRTGAEQFQNSAPALAKTARAAGAFWRAPGPRQLADLWRGYTDLIFGGINQGLELPPQLAMAGAHLRRRWGLSQREILRSTRAVDQAARGMMNTPEQIAMAEAIRRAYGQYFAFGPTGRQVIALYTPFAAWSLNALKFLYHVLPADHPALTALIADAHLASEEWRREHGLDLFMGRGALPGFLQGTWPTGGGGHFRGFTRYTPFGFASDPTDTLAKLLLPQVSGMQDAFEGRDWKGKELRNDDGTRYDPLQRFTYGVKEFGTALVPVTGKIEQYMGKEGPPGQRLTEMLNPFGVTPGFRGSGSTGPPAPGLGRGPALGRGSGLGRGPRLGRAPALGRP